MNFCTYFDHHFLSRGVALIHSLREHMSDPRVWALCLDDVCYARLRELGIPGVTAITLHDLEQADPALLHTKEDRTLTEYYFTCTPSLPLYILNHWKHVDPLTYLDADIWFFSDPAPLVEEIGDSSIAIVAHRYAPRLHHKSQFGTYNVAWLTFRRNETGLAALQWWRERCIEWCYRRLEDGRYADQKYLDDWPDRFEDVKVLQHKGANLAPWNVENYALGWDGRCVLVDDQPLIFYHFSGLRQVLGPLHDLGLAAYGVRPNRRLLESVYVPYLKRLLEVSHELESLPGARKSPPARSGQKMRALRRPWKTLDRVSRIPWDLFTGREVLVIGDRVVWKG